jgi:putative salt-induced outer membrane protein YdiY
MSRAERHAILLLAAGLMSVAGWVPTRAQDTPPASTGKWSDVAEFGYVATSGNSETATLGFKNTLGRKWDKTSFELKTGGVRAQTTTTTRTAVGALPPGSFTVFEQKDTALSAESYFLSGRFDRKLSERVFWFAGGGWSRNRFAGIQNRYEAAGGVGNLWVDSDRVKFRTDYALSYTKEDDVVRAPNTRDTFAGFRFSWKFEHKLGATTTFGNELVLDENLNDTSDLRGDLINSVAVSMSRRLALKLSLQSLYDHQPAFRAIDLLAPPPPGGAKIGTVLDELDTLDTIFTASLVVNF